MAQSHGIRLKKKHGQHFLRDEQYLTTMCDTVTLDKNSSVLEIGCGDGALTRTIMSYPITRLWVYEIDEEWAAHVRTMIPDERLKMHTENFLDADLSVLKKDAPWTVLANLPYNVTFPILHRFQQNRAHLKEGVVMMQEEVAQKIVKPGGRGYGYYSLFFQHYFSWKLLDKVPPSAFYPPPKVYSRLLYFKPILNPVTIPKEEKFWKFIKVCFKQPRRTLGNNLKGSDYATELLSEDQMKLRGQQMSMSDLLKVWKIVSA